MDQGKSEIRPTTNKQDKELLNRSSGEVPRMEQEGQPIALDVQISSTAPVPGGGGDNTPAEKETTLAMYTQVFLTLATKTFGPNPPTVNNNKAYKVYFFLSLLVFTFDFLFVLYFAALVAGVRVPPMKKMKPWIYTAIAISFLTFALGTCILLAA
ncbi:hypothetical protein J5N97_002161 [Dioscorea zingiberensis]|uniref:Uncharacterized protein n=1 Tax=Dioscorea zingiberensis TaxID=325984 RepID=A0A9D5HNY1_9LILI|nr:hypothetical protein J5N97_002161 [Dioscorea zingiberensis]